METATGVGPFVGPSDPTAVSGSRLDRTKELDARRAADWPDTSRLLPWALGVFTLIAVLSILANSETMVRLGEFDLAIKHLALLASYVVFFALAASIIRPSEV